MSKANDKALAFLEKSSQTEDFSEKFEVQEKASTPTFRAIFDTLPLPDKESSQIHTILEGAAENLSDADVEEDHQRLSEITTQIRGIERQNVILHGERVCKAQQILKRYRDGTFTKWLQMTYGNRQTPYRMLQFYDLYTKLEDQEKTIISAMPKRAAYVLASRSGEMEKKIEIIKEHRDSQPDAIIQAVQEAFPLKKSDKRKSLKKRSDAALLGVILPKIRKIKERKSLERIFDVVKDLLSKEVDAHNLTDQE